MIDKDLHELTQSLLPWYANGTLQPVEVATVEAHLGECDECRAELQLERKLGREIAQLSDEVEIGWSTLRDRLQRGARAPRPRLLPRLRSFLHFPIELRWALAGQFAVLVLLFGLVAGSTFVRPSVYRTLGSASTSSHGNIVAIFKPTISEASLRGAIIRSHARIVDGPTASAAYVLQTPTEQRRAALASLRADPGVELAEPIDAAP